MLLISPALSLAINPDKVIVALPLVKLVVPLYTAVTPTPNGAAVIEAVLFTLLDDPGKT